MDREQWQLLEPLLEHGMELPHDDRERWLREIAATTPDVAAALHALFSSEERADSSGFLLIPRAEPTLAGTELGAYTIERPLGQGGMGSVWLARRTDGRYQGVAAVKILNLSLMSARGQQRFAREGSALARLTHPGIARLLDAGVSLTGQPYLVLEHVDGQPIDQYARDLPHEARLRLFLQVVAAVSHAHANLIIHRDLKPSNILVTSDGTVKLLDFGIAKLLDAGDHDQAPPLTVDGGRVLTPEFAAPEQVKGDAITTATDVYALGVLLYILLSGKHPTAGESRTPADAMRAVLEVVPARLGLGDLDSVLAKALRTEPGARYQTVSAFGADVERYLNHEPVSAQPDAFTYRAGKFVRRHRAGVAAACITSVALIGATILSIVQSKEARAQRDAALHEAQLSGAMADIQNILVDERGDDGRALDAYERIRLAEHVLTHQYQATPWLVSEVMVSLAERYYDLGDRVMERALLARARDIARSAGALSSLALAECGRVYSFAYDDMNDSAQRDLAEARKALQQAGTPIEPSLESSCAAAEGKLLVNLGASDSAIRLLRRAVALRARAGGKEQIVALMDLGEVLRLSGHAREAVPYQRDVMLALEGAGYEATEKYPIALTHLDGSLRDIGELATLDSVLGTLVRRYEAGRGAKPVPPEVEFLYAQLMALRGEWDSSETWINRALRDEKGTNPWKVNWAPAVLTQINLEKGRLDDAVRAAATLPSGTRGRRAMSAWLRARIARAQGRSAEASRLLEGELAALANESDQKLWQFTLPYITASEWRLTSGDAKGADSLAQLAILNATRGDSLAIGRSAHVGRAELASARALRALGDPEAAYRAAQRATTAMEFGFGPTTAWASSARALRDSLSMQVNR